jgi:hypothetical protein
MPNPTQSDLHVNVPLTNISIAYVQDEDRYIADRVFPRVPVQHQSDLYWRYVKAEWRRTDAQKRAPSTETPGVGWNVETDQYYAHVYGVHKDIDDQLRANADSAFTLDKDATKFVTMQLLLKRDIDWHQTYFTTSVWDTDRAGVATGPTGTQFLRWDDAGSDPILDISNDKIDVDENTGFDPNTLVLGARTLNALRNHPDILDRIKYTQRGVLTADLLASFFEVDKVLVSKASQNTGEEYQKPSETEENADYKYLAGNHALLCYSAGSPGLMQPTAGYTFTWNGLFGGGDRGLRIKKFRMELIASDRIEGEMTYDMKVVSPDLGVFYSDTVS